ncbi:FapA family protein [Jeotgalibacillus haloalkalitolerans]|uniref:FapA family protein n=1 Tax=Jeotgalibacillus haloalkalitolerans TaxID=3104292 RepID=A0ABU5KKJ1_9BACL|nr:FapA family protein [Jeotgalibacillus sp. HH7-29]MDZ5711461.1 FapA family protein [Jeotgalibacillus sp. HH7-29]
MQSIVSRGKSIKEAVQTGVELLEVSKRDVHIEVLQNPAKGFLKMGSKQAVVRLTLLNENRETSVKTDVSPSPGLSEEQAEVNDWFAQAEYFFDKVEVDRIEPEINQPPKKSFQPTEGEMLERNGAVWVEDGRLMVEPGTHKLPIITIPKEITLYRNQHPVDEKTFILSANDSYRLVIEDQIKETEWSITIDHNKLKAYLEVNPGYKITRTIQDAEPSSHLTLAFKEEKQTYLTLTERDIKEDMQEKSILQNIDQIELMRAVRNTEPETYTIARGVAPADGKDGWLELMVDTHIKEGMHEDDQGKVDFRETKVFPNIETGDIIGIVHPSVEGSSGYSVFSETIPPKPVYPVILRLGKGVKLIGDQVVAKEFGRPHIEERGQLVKIMIMPKLLHSGDVNLESGNISFFGDVEITGEVHNGMKIEAQGNVIIAKNISGSVCNATGAISVKGNVISSDLSAGQSNMVTSKLSMLVGILKQDIDRIIAVITQLVNSPGFKSTDFAKGGLQPLVRILMEKKFQDFRPRAKRYVQLVKEGRAQLDDERWEETAEQISSLFVNLSAKPMSLNIFTHLSQKLAALQEEVELFDETKSTVSVQNVLNSRIHAGGNLFIKGQSCVNSRIHAGGYMTITGTLRGGEAYAEKGMYIGGTGAESGTPTNLSVPSNATIKIGTALEGTVLKIGNRKIVLTEDHYAVTASINAKGQIILR